MAAILAIVLGCSALVHPPCDTLLREEYSFGLFENATRIAVSPQGWVYVVDEGKNTVLLFKESGGSPIEVGGFGWGTGAFDHPSGVTTDGNNVYVSDHGNHRIQRFDRNLNYLSSLSTRDTTYSPARFGFPSGIALSPLGDLFILDGENNRAVKFRANSQFERSFGDVASARQKLVGPKQIHISDEKVFIAESDALLLFDYLGNYGRAIGENLLSNIQGFDASEESIVVAEEDCLYWFSLQGEFKSVLNRRAILTETPSGPFRDVSLRGDMLYVLDAHRVSLFRIVHP